MIFNHTYCAYVISYLYIKKWAQGQKAAIHGDIRPDMRAARKPEIRNAVSGKMRGKLVLCSEV